MIRAGAVLLAITARVWADVPTPSELGRRVATVDPPPAEAAPDPGARLDEIHEELEVQKSRLAQLGALLHVYADVGWFATGGDGSGIRSDVGHRYVPDAGAVPANWVFLGDSMTTAINALGEPADLGPARAIKHDTIDSAGRPTLLVNALGIALARQVESRVAIDALAQIRPRADGVILDLERAQIDYRPVPAVVISAGKVDSVLGLEYRAQDATARRTVTPSLTCRYTCGRPYGVRAQWLHADTDVSAELANGDAFSARFEPDARLASSSIPTLSAHVIRRVQRELAIGASGSIGPQDGQSDLGIHQWHYGTDARWTPLRGLDLQAEWVQGRQQGSTSGAADAMPELGAAPCNTAPCLRYKAAYLLALWRWRPTVQPYARIDWRDARHQRGLEFLYVSRVLRGTVGFAVDVVDHVVVKVEYSNNRELLGPQFPNDVLTGSVVVSTR